MPLRKLWVCCAQWCRSPMCWRWRHDPPQTQEGDMGEGPVEGTRSGRSRRRWHRSYTAVLAAGALAVGGAVSATAAGASVSSAGAAGSAARPVSASAYRVVAPASTPIKHVVVLFDENVSFDHYFGTYPYATNTDGSPFHAKPGTPSVNGLTPALLTHNPNTYNPTRLTHAQALTCDQDHGYTAEQLAFKRRQDEPVRPGDRDTHLHRDADDALWCTRLGHGLLRRQHRHRAVELCPALRPERQQLRHELRAVHAGRAQCHLRQRQPRLRGQSVHRCPGRRPGPP